MTVMGREQTAPIVFRPGRTADAEALATLHLDSWRATYDPMLDPHDRTRLNLGERLAAWQRRLAQPSGRVCLALRDGLLVGFVAVEVAHDEDLDSCEGEVTSLHVRPDLHGQGIGRRLLAEGEALLRTEGCHAAVLWVLAANGPARAFYERCGWQADGVAAHRPMGGLAGLPLVDEVRYRRSL